MRWELNKITKQYGGKPAGYREPQTKVSLTGRIKSIRSAGKKLIFLELYNLASTLQVMLVHKHLNQDMEAMVERLHRGDIYEVKGFPGVSNRGEVSLIAEEISLLAPCKHNLPKPNQLDNKEIIHSNRPLDLLVNESAAKHFFLQSLWLDEIRQFFSKREFLEVHTGILKGEQSGSSALDFETWSKGKGKKMYMRNALELPLKQCVIGGYSRVYEIGKVFRNEGIDKTHSPEFTMIEAYASSYTIQDLIEMSQDLLGQLERRAEGILAMPGYSGESTQISIREYFEGRCGRVPFGYDDDRGALEGLYKEAREDGLEARVDIHQREIEVEKMSRVDIIEDIIDHYIIHPMQDKVVYVTDYPSILSPLARYQPDSQDYCLRSECYIGGMEVMNMYEEEYDVELQREKFIRGETWGKLEQAYVASLELGLPPTGGWGMGLERCFMSLLKQSNIKSIILDP